MSTQPNIPLYGRKWNLTITPSDGSDPIFITSDTEPNSLRITFDIEYVAYQAIQTAMISVYNLNAVSTQVALRQGSQIVLNGGYQVGSNYGTLFDGFVIRSTFEKENVTDYKLTMQCVNGLDLLINNMVNFATGPFQSQQKIIEQIAANAMKTFQVAGLDPALGTTSLPKPKVLFGQPKKYMEQIARDNNMTWMIGSNGVFVGNFDFGPNTVADVVYSPAIPPGSTQTPDPGVSYSILGTPQQTPQGLALRVLLDARMVIKLPPVAVKVDNSFIKFLPITPGEYPPVLTPDGLYAVGAVRHYGDSYLSNNWLTEIQAFVTSAQKLAILGIATGSGAQAGQTQNIRTATQVG